MAKKKKEEEYYKPKKRKLTTWDKIFYTGNFIFMFAFVVITLYPILNTLAISFNDGIDAVRGGQSRKQLVKSSEKSGLYVALDIADVWLERALKS